MRAICAGSVTIGGRIGGAVCRVLGGRRCTGFTYIALLLLVAMMSISLAVVAQVWHTMQRREKEAQLLFVGNQIRRAIARYGAATPAGQPRYPSSLEDLLKDPRYADVHRYLRKVYRDPMTASADWGLVKAGNGILGVYSLSEKEPIKQGGFAAVNRNFEQKTKYSEWKFVQIVGAGSVPVRNKPPVIPQPQPGTVLPNFTR